MSNNFEKKQFSTISEDDFNSLISVIPHSSGNIYSQDPFETLTGYYHNNELIAYKADLYMAGSQILITDEFFDIFNQYSKNEDLI